MKIKIPAIIIFLSLYLFTACGGNSSGGNIPLNSSSKTLLSFSIISPSSSGIIDESLKTVSLTVPYGTDVTGLVAYFTTTGVSTTVNGVEQTSSTTPNNFTNPVLYTVHAQDGSSAQYTVTVRIASGDEKAITSYSIPGAAGVINESEKKIKVTVPSGTDVTGLVATFSTTGASVKVNGTVQVSGTTPNDFTGPVVYRVTAADGSYTDYTVTVSNPANPGSADTLPAPSGTDTWYSFQNDYFGMALVGTTFIFDEDSFEETCYYWDGDSWEILMAFRGSMTPVSGSEYDATLEAIYILGDENPAMAWYTTGTGEFDSDLSHVWSTAGKTARVSLAVSGDTMIYKRDFTGDDLFNSQYDFTKNYSRTTSTTLQGHGKYPLLLWTSWSFHGNSNRASSSGQPDSVLGEILDNSSSSLIQSIKGIAKDQNGNTYGPFDYTWDPEDEEFNIEYTFTDPVLGGIWWLAELRIVYKNGASALYTAADPWSKYKVTYVTDTGYVSPSPAVAWDLTAAQDYMPPDTAGSGCSFYYVRTLPNASCDLAPDYSDYTDSTVYIYSADDTTKWLARNDDFDNDFSGVYAAIKYPFESGKTYYVTVEDLNHNTRPYSIIVQSGYYVDRSTGTVVIENDDAYEDDDTPATAKDLPLNTVQDRVSTSGDEDWMKLVFDATPTSGISGTWDVLINNEQSSSGYISIVDENGVLSGFYHSNTNATNYDMTGTVTNNEMECYIEIDETSFYNAEVTLDANRTNFTGTLIYITGMASSSEMPVEGAKR